MTIERFQSQTAYAPDTDRVLGTAALLMAEHFESSFEAQQTLEGQAFATWLHGAYLSIFTHLDEQTYGSSLLSRRINRMLTSGAKVLGSSSLSAVAELARPLFDDFCATDNRPKLSSRALLSLAIRIPLGPLAKQLAAWVDWAYGDAPNSYENVTYFGICADGCLYQAGMPTLDRVPTSFFTRSWMKLPAFWRVLYVASGAVVDRSQSAALVMLHNVVSNSALPLSPPPNHAILFTNYIALLREIDFLFGPYINSERNAILAHRLLQPWHGKPIVGARQAEDWVRWVASQQSNDLSAETASILYLATQRTLGNPLNPLIFASLEAADPKADDSDDDADDKKKKTTAPVDDKKSGDTGDDDSTGDDTDTDDDNTATDKDSDSTDDDADADADTDTSTDDDTTTTDDTDGDDDDDNEKKTKALGDDGSSLAGDTPPDQLPNEDGGSEENPAVPGDDTADPQADKKNNSIGEISLAEDADAGYGYLYRRAVLSLNEVLARDPNIEINQDVRETLRLWCRDWIWLASVTQTETLIKDLGLQKALGPVAKKD